jgi:hypothetical protein
MAGDSATGAAKKLGVTPGTTLVVVDGPEGWTLPQLPPGVEVVRRRCGEPAALAGPSTVVAFFRSAAGLDAALDDLVRLVRPATALWLAWPRRAAGHRSDLTDNVVRDLALASGLVDNKVAAIDEDWSGLRFVWRKEHRGRRLSEL